jgi:hypothetical protein
MWQGGWLHEFKVAALESKLFCIGRGCTELVFRLRGCSVTETCTVSCDLSHGFKWLV